MTREFSDVAARPPRPAEVRLAHPAQHALGRGRLWTMRKLCGLAAETWPRTAYKPLICLSAIVKIILKILRWATAVSVRVRPSALTKSST